MVQDQIDPTSYGFHEDDTPLGAADRQKFYTRRIYHQMTMFKERIRAFSLQDKTSFMLLILQMSQ